ncbi:MAG: 5-formaminoimidazole-4-carboxamide-1-(beta)-D-ribofuranosyl 5'-monophosphate synthetase [Candidatus Altiarchaeales archaeon ex4484_96]|nr:MAG: 5-formaminoimidazole-4-carboxamide-1-(beta)-D-ribofuranosyl 5'-monophosphate synthetase [Candidatus Altiarchaeales archaeon ex4484_96]
MISQEQINETLNGYDFDNILVCTLGSHTALQITKGARDENLRNLLLCTKKAARFYRRWPVVDEIITLEHYANILDERLQDELIAKNAIIIPHGSFVEYVGAKNINEKLRVPMLGNRLVLEWESNRRKEKKWFKTAGLGIPGEFKSPQDIDRLVIVKFPGAKGGEGYFLAKDEEEFYKKLDEINLPDEIKKQYTIQEYVIGTRFYPHFFYSPLDDELELLGMDIRYESNIDGLARLPNVIQKEVNVEPLYVVTGNLPVILRESLLPDLMKMGRSLVESSKRLFKPGLIGPFCVEMICTPELKFICFEISARIVAGTNLFIHGSTYSKILYDEPMSCGRRICREIKTAGERNKLDKVIY